jgi:hypothetical protein
MMTATVAFAGLSAEAELGYADYESRQTAGKRSASSFVQRYTLLYATGARLGGGQTGYYLLSGGYEWASIDTSLHFGDANRDQSLSSNAGHILYSGELLYDPRELPIRIKAFSRDTSRTQFAKTAALYEFAGGAPVIDPGISDTVQSGTNITSGLILTLGVKNGMSNGFYSIFKDLPRLFVSYWDNIQRFTRLDAALDTHQRRLAVVLNKKENWIHYRRNTYDDFRQPSQGTDEQRIIIGQIDEALDRHWVDLTNWIKISADGTFTKSVNAGQLTNETDVNLMTIMSREKWQARTINSYSHVQSTNGTYQYTSRNPVYLSGIWGSDADWFTRFSYEVEKTAFSPTALSYQRDTYGSAQLTTFKRSNFTLTSMVAVESLEFNQDKSLVTEMRVESASTRRFSDTLSLVGSYDLKWMNSEGSANGGSTVQTVSGSAVYRLSNRVTAEIGQEFNVGSGARNTDAGGAIAVTPTTADSGFGLIPDSYVRSVTHLRLSWLLTERLQMLAMATQDYLMQSARATDSLTTASHILTYRRANLEAGTELRYSKRTGREDGDGITAKGNVEYAFNRSASGGLKVQYARDQSAGSVGRSELEAEQSLGYNYFNYSGQGRKLVELVENFHYLQREGFANETRKTAKLNAKYFPTRHLYLAGSLAYSWIHAIGDSTELAGTGEVGVNYSKLQASLGYSYGRRDGISFDNRIDKRFAANLRKQF